MLEDLALNAKFSAIIAPRSADEAVFQ